MIDSPWTTRYNDFIVDESRYPNPEQFFGDLQNNGYRVVLWMTCFVNSRNKDTAIEDSSDWYQEAAAERGLELDKAAARELVYGMPYDEFKEKHQTPASAEKMAQLNASNPHN